MRKWVTIFLVGILPSISQAAGPAMHVLLGQQWLAHNAPQYTDEEKKLFLLGTLFPDIRYLGVLKRTESHFKAVTLEKVYQASTPFQRGMLFHSFVDEFRDKWVRRNKIDKKLSGISHPDTFLKLIEDQIVHTQNDWSQLRGYLAHIPEDEKKFEIDLQSLTQWHTGLTFYFSTQPSLILMQFSIFEKGVMTLDAATIKSWSVLLPQYAQDKVFKDHVENMCKSFHLAMQQQATLSKK